MNFWDAIEKITGEHYWFLLVWTAIGIVVIMIDVTLGHVRE